MYRMIMAILMLVAVMTRVSTAQPVQKLHDGGLRFTENHGQVVDMKGSLRPDILYTTGSGGVQVYLRKTGISYVFRRIENASDPAEHMRSNLCPEEQHGLDSSTRLTLYRLDMELVGANPSPRVTSEEPSEDYTNYYLPHCPDGITHVSSYGRVVYHDVYPNIDMVLYSSQGRMKYDFVIQPGGRVESIQMQYVGMDSMRYMKNGSVEVSTMLGSLTEGIPLIYQPGEHESKSLPVEGTYRPMGTMIGFAVGEYDPTQTLVIDPTLAWSTFYGGSDYDQPAGNTVIDRAGNLLISGWTESTDFPVTTGAFQTVFGGGTYNGDAFVLKMNRNGGRMWATYYGGSADDNGAGVTTDTANAVYVVGYTTSSNFPVSSSPFQGTYGGGTLDGFLVKLDSAGARMWGTYYGGNGYESANGITSDNAGNVAVSGLTTSQGLATTGVFQTTLQGVGNAFVAKFSSSGARIWATYFGAGNESEIVLCSSDRQSNVIITGSTGSTSLPVTNGAYQTTPGGLTDLYVASFGPNGTLRWATYLGGMGPEFPAGIATDRDSNIVIVGETRSVDFPTTVGALQTSMLGNKDGFVTSFNAAGQLRWSTYCGGWLPYDAHDAFTGVATANNGDVVAVGLTTCTDFPVTSDAYQSVLSGTGVVAGAEDAVIVKFDNSGRQIWGTYLGGLLSETRTGVAVDQSALYVTGATSSNDFPVTSGAFQSSLSGNYSDLFITKFCDVIPPVSVSGPRTICPGDSVTLTASPGYEIYLWSNGAVTPSITVKQSGNYSVSATLRACSGRSDTIRVSLFQTTSPRITRHGSNTICAGDSVVLDIPNVYRNQRWSTGDSLPRIVVRTAGSYFVSVVDTNGCLLGSDTVRITVNPRPTALITRNGPTMPCQGDTIELDGGADFTRYWWSTGDTTRKIKVATTGIYRLRVTDANGCVDSTKTEVKFELRPWQAIAVLGATTICGGDSVMLDAGYGYRNYKWSSGQTSQRIAVKKSGRYSVRFESLLGCPGSSDTVEITVNPRPIASISGAVSVCANARATYAVADTPGVIYTWSVSGGGGVIESGVGTPEIVVQWGSSGMGSVHAIVTSRQSGCRSESEVMVDVGAGVKPQIIPSGSHSSGRMCIGDSMMLDAGPGYASYRWSTGDSTRRIITHQAGVYSVSVSDSGGCTGTSAPYAVMINEPPQPEIAASGLTAFCSGDSVVLDAGDYASYAWSNGSVERQIVVRDAGIYTVTARDTVGCEGVSLPVHVEVYPEPDVTIEGPNSVCISAEEEYTARDESGSSYAWSVTPGGVILSGQGTSRIRVQWATAGTEGVNLEMTTSEGCRGVAEEYRVEVGTTLTPTVTASRATTLCAGDSVTLTAAAGYSSYQWSSGERTRGITVRAGGVYWVTVESSGGCSGKSKDVTVTVHPRPDVAIEPGGPITLCAGDSVELVATAGYSEYQWSNGERTDRIVVSKGGDYSVMVINLAGCAGESRVVRVTELPVPSVPVIHQHHDTLSTDAAVVYQWLRDGQLLQGATLQELIVQEAGTYSVRVTDANGCSAESEPYVVNLSSHAIIVRLDTVSAAVGDRLRMHLRVSPALEEDDGVDGYSAELRINPRSLFVHGASNAFATGGQPTLKYTSDGRILIDYDESSGAIAGEELFEIEMEGLATGEPVNEVEIVSVELRGIGAVEMVGNGLVLLSGCDIATGFGFGKRVRIESVSPNPVTGEARISYRAPAGSTPELVLRDLLGRESIRTVLPTGTGATQTATISTSDAASGVYMLELCDKAERSAIPLIIAR